MTATISNKVWHPEEFTETMIAQLEANVYKGVNNTYLAAQADELFVVDEIYLVPLNKMAINLSLSIN